MKAKRMIIAVIACSMTVLFTGCANETKNEKTDDLSMQYEEENKNDKPSIQQAKNIISALGKAGQRLFVLRYRSVLISKKLLTQFHYQWELVLPLIVK